jgi:two-component system OmpR family sensor kinase
VTLQRRLLLFGAVLPASLTALGLVVIGFVFGHLLIESVDRGLVLQAASESVSLFDRPGQDAHLHFEESTLIADLQRLQHRGALYGPDGARLLAYPDDGAAPAVIDLGTVGATPRLTTREVGGERIRELTVAIVSPRGEPHGVWLAVSLASHDAAMRAYAWTAGLVGVGVTLLMLLLQIGHARGLGARVQRLHAHMRRVSDGDFSAAPAVDAGTDVIAGLRDAIADATGKLQAAAVGQHRLIADAAHELRTPLTAMRMEIDVTLRRPRSNEELMEALTRVRAEVDRLGVLATQLLDMASLRRADWERVPIDAAALVRAAVDGHRAPAERRGVTLMVQGPEQVAVRANPGPLRQAVDNLLANAIKFSPQGGAVEVTLRPGESELTITVEDRGAGVPVGEREAIFAPFHRLQRGSEGAGLGLAIVREVAEAHGGRAFVGERAGGGACFSLVVARG